MNLTVSKETVNEKQIKCRGKADETIDCDVTLPEYCPDILRILKCRIIPRVISGSINSDRLSIEGSALVSILYVDENEDCVHSYEQICPFGKTVDVGGIYDNAYVNVKADADYVNCRAVNQRRLSINASLSLKYEIFTVEKSEILCRAEGCSIQTKSRDVEVCSVKGFAQKNVTVDETIELCRGEEAAVSRLIRYSGNVIATQAKVITNRIMLKGDLVLSLLYTEDNGNGIARSITHTLPISQVIDAEGISDEDDLSVRLTLSSLDVALRSDSNGEFRQADVVAKISAEIISLENVSTSVILEAYSTKYEITSEKQKRRFLSLNESVKELHLHRGSIDVSSVGVSEIIDLWVTDITSTAVFNDEKLLIKGVVNLSLLVRDVSGKPAYLERQSEFETAYSRKTAGEKSECEPEITLNALSFSLTDSGSVSFGVELNVSANVFSVDETEIITKISADESVKKDCVAGAITIYFCEENESVWEIAKRYNTTPRAIMEENNLTGETISSSQMLIIPSV